MLPRQVLCDVPIYFRRQGSGGYWRSGQSGNLKAYPNEVLSGSAKRSAKENKDKVCIIRLVVSVKVMMHPPYHLKPRVETSPKQGVHLFTHKWPQI